MYWPRPYCAAQAELRFTAIFLSKSSEVLGLQMNTMVSAITSDFNNFKMLRLL